MRSPRTHSISKLATVSSLALVIFAAIYVILSTGSSYSYTLRFETGGQLVPGNEVRIGGPAVGSVDSIDLGDDFIAEVGISIDRRLPEGTRATIRTTSQSGIANRYVALMPGPAGTTMLTPGTTISQAATTAPVDFDQLLSAFGPRTRAGLRRVIRAGATIIGGRGRAANDALRYLSPALAENSELFQALAADADALERFLGDGETVFAALANRREALANLVSDGDRALGALAAENQALSLSLSRLPGFLRDGERTLGALREARRDLDPLVVGALDATPGLAGFLRQATPVLDGAQSVLVDLADAARREGDSNDLVELLAAAPRANRAAADAAPRAIAALSDSEQIVSFARPYAPDLLAWVTKFGQSAAYYDANGHYVRVSPANANIFARGADGVLDPIYDDPGRQLDGMQLGAGEPCPGAAIGPAADGSSPFTDRGRLRPTDCDPAFVPPGG